jgi:hypothetical protein
MEVVKLQNLAKCGRKELEKYFNNYFGGETKD